MGNVKSEPCSISLEYREIYCIFAMVSNKIQPCQWHEGGELFAELVRNIKSAALSDRE